MQIQASLNRCRGDEKIKIAVLDTGVDCDHPKIRTCNCIKKENCRGFPPKFDPCSDRHGHGTFIADVLSQVAGDSIDILIARVISDSGQPCAADQFQEVANVMLPFGL